MKKWLFLPLAAFMIAGPACAGFAAEPAPYDRYERGYRLEPPPPPPPRTAAPVPQPRRALYNQPYFAVQMGFFTPNDDYDGLDGFDTGGSFNLAIGARMSPFFAVEGTLGGYSAERDNWTDDEVAVVPLTVGGRLIVPNPYVEPYFGAGFGLYFSSLDDYYLGTDDESIDFGAYLSFGLDFWVNPRVALNLEGRYHWVEAEFEDYTGFERDVDIGGWTVNFGVRVCF